MPDFWPKSLEIDPKRAISARFAVSEQREILSAIIIINHELENIRSRSREPMLCQIRYQFWRDFLQGQGTNQNLGLVGDALKFILNNGNFSQLIEDVIDAHSDYALSLSSGEKDNSRQMDLIFENLISFSIQALLEVEPENIAKICASSSVIFGKALRHILGKGEMPTREDFNKLNVALYDFDDETIKTIMPSIAYLALCKKAELFSACNVEYESLNPWAKLRAEFAISTTIIRRNF